MVGLELELQRMPPMPHTFETTRAFSSQRRNATRGTAAPLSGIDRTGYAGKENNATGRNN